MLSRDHVTLQFMTETHIGFCETAEEGEDLTDLAEHPFLMLAQWQRAARLVLVPRWAVPQLAKQCRRQQDKKTKTIGEFVSHQMVDFS